MCREKNKKIDRFVRERPEKKIATLVSNACGKKYSVNFFKVLPAR